MLRAIALFFSLGIVRAIVGQAIGMAVGYGLVAGIRQALGLDPSPEAAWVSGALFSVLGALLLAGVLTDWLKWAVGKDPALRHGPPGLMTSVLYRPLIVSAKALS